ncbi:MAG: ATP-binding protein [Vulcanimicrobiota bacterium]
MQLEGYSVQGYKNLTAEVKLVALEKLNVIHGDNDVGKSNLLESIELAFRLLGRKRLPFHRAEVISPAEFQKETGRPLRFAFNLESPAPIIQRLRLSVGDEELRASGIQPLLPCETIEVTIRLENDQAGGAAWTVKFEFADGTTTQDLNEEKGEYARRFAWFLASHHLVGNSEGRPRFQLVSANRLPLDTPGESHLPRNLIPSSLALELYDASQSADAQMRERWSLYANTVGKLLDLGANERVVARYDRHAERASLAVERQAGRLTVVPMELMGSGTQQIAALLGHALVSGATLLAVEEPEMNLRYSRQLALRDALADLTRDSRGPTQLILSSHSPAFEVGGTFYAMENGREGPDLGVSELR